MYIVWKLVYSRSDATQIAFSGFGKSSDEKSRDIGSIGVSFESRSCLTFTFSKGCMTWVTLFWKHQT